MEKFSLDEWLKDKSRKIVTRDGRPVRILCTDAKAKDGCCIIAAIETDGEEEGYQFFKDGKAYSSKSSIEDCADLFFADGEEELTEFEKAIYIDICTIVTACDGRVYGYKELKPIVKGIAKQLIDIARKELAPISWRENLRKYKEGREQGKQDILKDIPKWKKSDRNWITNICDLATIVKCDGGDHEDYDSVVVSNRVYKDDYYIELGELLKLPKEE